MKEVFTGWLEQHEPTRAGKILSLIRQARGGALYDSRFDARMRGEGPYAAMLRRRFEVARKRYGFVTERPSLDISGFRVPGRPSAPRGLFAT